MNVAIYARISTDRTGEEAGVNRQLADCRELAQRHGVTVVSEVVENDTSAYSRKARPEYQHVVEMVKAGTVQGIYCWHPDRLYRRLRDLEDLVDLVESHDLVIRTVKAGDIDLNTSSGRMTARLIGSVAQHESEQKADRQARKHRELAEAGRSSGGGRRALGYEAGGATVNEVEAQALRDAAEAIIAGTTLTDATRQFATTVGRSVRSTGLKGALTGHRIVGLRQHIPAADRRRGVTTGVVTEAVWPAILDEQTWRKVSAILLDPRRTHARPVRAYLLSGILRCGLCGSPMSGGANRYRCDARNDGCAKLSVASPPVDAFIEAFVLRHVDDPKVRTSLTHLPSGPASGPDTGALQARLLTLAEMLADGQMSPDEWRAARDRVMSRISERQSNDADAVKNEALARRVTSVLADWDGADLAARRGVVDAILDAEFITVVIEGRSKRNGSKFDPSRVRMISPAELVVIQANRSAPSSSVDRQGRVLPR